MDFFQTEYQQPEKEDTWIDVTRRETLEAAETAIDSSVEHYAKKSRFLERTKSRKNL